MQPSNPAPPAPQQPTQAQIQADQALATCRDLSNFAVGLKIRAASVQFSEDARRHCFDTLVELARLFGPPPNA